MAAASEGEGGASVGHDSPIRTVSVVEMEGRDPITIIPEEVWKLVFKRLENQDLLSCTRTCGAFEDILRPKLCTWLFRSIFPHVFPYLEKEQILACRATGKEWNKVVDGFLENHGYYLPFDESTNDSRHTTLYLPLMDKGFGWTEFHNTEQVTSFMEVIRNPVRNPFIGRSIWIQYQEDLEYPLGVRGLQDPFWPTVLRFLSEYGKYVWYFSMGTFGSKNTTSRFLYLVRECLASLPNLKSLHIFGWISQEDVAVHVLEGENNDLNPNPNPNQNLIFEDEDEIADYLTENPLPLPPSLETMEIEYMEDLPDVVYEHMITLQGNQLKCLQLTKWNFLTLNTNLPNLRELHIKIRSLDQLDKFFLRLKSPLGKLNLDFSFVETSLDIERLFRLISDNFGESLRVLQMLVVPFTFEPAGNEDEWKPQPRLRTPLLQTLQLEGFKRLSLNFLMLVSSSLQYLHLRHLSPEHRVKPYPDEVVDIYEYMHCNQLYKSNVWEKLPKLKVLSSEFFDKVDDSYTRRFYHREMHEYLNRGAEAEPEPENDNLNVNDAP